MWVVIIAGDQMYVAIGLALMLCVGTAQVICLCVIHGALLCEVPAPKPWTLPAAFGNYDIIVKAVVINSQLGEKLLLGVPSASYRITSAHSLVTSSVDIHASMYRLNDSRKTRQCVAVFACFSKWF